MERLIERVYAEHRQGLFTLALSITHCPHMAEDAVHDAVARVCHNGFAVANDPVSYLFRAVRNASIDQLRQQDRRQPSRHSGEVALFADVSGTSDDPLVVNERAKLVQEALRALPPDSREVVVMRIYAELTFEQIAEALKENLSTVASRYRRALDKLRNSLGDSGDQ